jgi:hypothetical protein
MALLKFKCECGKHISARTAKVHLRCSKTYHSESFIKYCLDILEKSSTYSAWKKTEGEEALAIKNWGVKVLRKELSIDELVFERPRSLGIVRPSTLKRFSKDRTGINNPVSKKQPKYDTLKIKEFAKCNFITMQNNYSKFRELSDLLEKKFPKYQFNIIKDIEMPELGRFRGYNKKNYILSYLLDMPIKDIVYLKSKDRGFYIKKGQQKSPNLIKIKNANKKKLNKNGFVSLHHRILYNMVLNLDPLAVMEKQIDYQDTWKSYDIYSPKINTLIEMHGHIWHSLEKCFKNIEEIVKKNVENDKIKKELANSMGIPVFVFWDNETHLWEQQLKDLYGKEGKKYEEAFREESAKKRKNIRL